MTKEDLRLVGQRIKPKVVSEAIPEFIRLIGKFGSRDIGESGDFSGVGTKEVKLRVLAMAEQAVADFGINKTFERDWGELNGRTYYGLLDFRRVKVLLLHYILLRSPGQKQDSAGARFGGEVTMTF